MNIYRQIKLLVPLLFLSIACFAQSNSRTVVIQGQPFLDTILSNPNSPTIPAAGQPDGGVVSIVALPGNGLFKLTYNDAGYEGYDDMYLQHDTGFGQTGIKAYKFKVVKSVMTPENDFVVSSNGQSVASNVLRNDHTSSSTMQITGISNVQHGTASFQDSLVYFSPDLGFEGIARVNYTVCDDKGTCEAGLLSISVISSLAANKNVQLYTVKEEKVFIPMPVYGMAVTQPPSNGSAAVSNGFDAEYVPNAGFTGVDQFEVSGVYNGQTIVRDVSVEVFPTSQVNEFAIEDYVFTPIDIATTFNVGSNDYGNFYIQSYTDPDHGSVNWLSGTTFEYTPEPGFQGATSFSYTISSPGNANLETAIVNIGVGNQAPVAGTYYMSTPKETPFVINYDVPFVGFEFAITNQPNNGVLDYYEGATSITINGQNVSGYNLLVYTPNGGFSGHDEFRIDYCIPSTGDCDEVKIDMDILNTVASGNHCVTECVWSGDVNDDGIVDMKDLLTLSAQIGENGVIRSHVNNPWFGQHGNSWNNPFYVSDLKYADTNGDGQLTAEDANAISDNYAQTHKLIPHVPLTQKPLPLFFGPPSIANPQAGDHVTVPIYLGNSTYPAKDFYGYEFTINYWVDAVDNMNITFLDDSWMSKNAAAISMVKSPYNGRIDAGYGRTSRVSASGLGQVAVMDFIIDDVLDGIAGESLTFTLNGNGANGLTSFGLEGATLELPIGGYSTNRPAFTNDNLEVFPNPSRTSDVLQLYINGGFVVESIVILDAQGRVLHEALDATGMNQYVMTLSNFAPGIYFAQAIGTTGVATQKFEVID